MSDVPLSIHTSVGYGATPRSTHSAAAGRERDDTEHSEGPLRSKGPSLVLGRVTPDRLVLSAARVPLVALILVRPLHSELTIRRNQEVDPQRPVTSWNSRIAARAV